MTTDPRWPSITRVYHESSYPAINPKNLALSTARKSLLITGAGSGIGRAAALSFARSGIESIALVGRREAPLAETAQLIAQETSTTKVHVYATDLVDRSSLEKAITSFTQNLPSGKIDIVFANAGSGADIVPLAALPVEILTRDFAANAVGNLNLLQLVNPYLATDATIIHTSTGAAHANIPGNSSYAITKAAGALIFQQWAFENPNHFVITFHPGSVETPLSLKVAENGLALGGYDDISLPADFSVWAASSQARALGSGKFVWAHWDVDDLLKLAADGVFEKFITKSGLPTPSVAQLGLVGWPPVQAQA